ncbi:MAG: GNAT family N-acetyltransferase [Thermoproteus sp.]|nr:GNAT family N-acetyltransferase [Thermoproteus sp.]
MALKLRRAEEGDIPDIISFTSKTWEWGDYIPRVIGSWVRQGRAYVVEAGGAIVAVAGLELVGDSAYLQGLRVRPEYRGVGIGAWTTAAMAEEAKRLGARRATLLVAEWNEPSIRAVAKAGFRRVWEVYGGVPDRRPPSRCLEGEEAADAVEEALRRTGGLACMPDDPWICTYASAEELLRRGRPCLGEAGLYVGKFSFGGGGIDAEGDAVAARPDGFRKLYGRYLLFARVL